MFIIMIMVERHEPMVILNGDENHKKSNKRLVISIYKYEIFMRV